ncbi:MAG: MTH1187 family thiamine-binding protein [Desulfonauticus sp.]|nr:MTH1187 family thiamine-binding protein [Desulfonauticus sp.]
MSTLVELAIFPLDKGESVSQYVAKAVKVIQNSNLSYKLTPMGTCIEGDFDQVMEVVKQCFKTLEPECDRIYLNLKLDFRKNRTNALEQKIDSIKKQL